MFLDIENLIHFFFGIRIPAKTNQAIGSNQDIFEYVDAIVEQSVVSANQHSIARIETTHCCFPEILVRNVKDIETRYLHPGRYSEQFSYELLWVLPIRRDYIIDLIKGQSSTSI